MWKLIVFSPIWKNYADVQKKHSKIGPVPLL